MYKIYLAGPLFGAADRHHNLHLERKLQALGYTVLLPQRRAKDFVLGNHFDLDALAQDCAECAADPNVIYVGNIDGADPDAGTAMEYGTAIKATRRAVIYRTDFRTDIEQEIGIPAMFRMKGTKLVYHPCYISDLSEVEPYYTELALAIHKAIQSFA